MNLSALKSNHHQQVRTKITPLSEQIHRQNQILTVVLVATVTSKMFHHPKGATPVNMLLQERTKQSQAQSFQPSERIEKYIY